jgi:hypothetical protein
MTEATVPIRLTHMWRRRGDKVVVFSDAHFNLVRLELNPVGSRVWELMDGQNCAGDIANQIAEEYPGVPRARILSGVLKFLAVVQNEWLAISREEYASYE